MPMYEYECTTCGNAFDMLRSMSQADTGVVCVQCGSEQVQRKLSVFASFSKEAGGADHHHHHHGGGGCSSGMCGCSGSSCSF